MTRIVSYVNRYKRPPRKRKAVALDVPAVVATKRSRRPTWKGGDSVFSSIAPPDHDGAAQPSTPGDAKRDRAVTSPPPADGDRKSAIVSTTSRKRLKMLRAEKRPAQRDDDREAMARVRAFFARNVRPGGPLPPKRR
jgi:hypothetical protein